MDGGFNVRSATACLIPFECVVRGEESSFFLTNEWEQSAMGLVQSSVTAVDRYGALKIHML